MDSDHFTTISRRLCAEFSAMRRRFARPAQQRRIRALLVPFHLAADRRHPTEAAAHGTRGRPVTSGEQHHDTATPHAPRRWLARRLHGWGMGRHRRFAQPPSRTGRRPRPAPGSGSERRSPARSLLRRRMKPQSAISNQKSAMILRLRTYWQREWSAFGALLRSLR